MATAGGGFLFIMPLATLALAAVWASMAKLTKVASISSLTVVALAIPVALWSGATGWGLAWMVAIIVLIVWRHRPNIQRMLQGSEEKVPT